MLYQVLTYWKVNWLPLVTGIVIAAIVVPLVKTSAVNLFKVTTRSAAWTRNAHRKARSAAKRFLAAKGWYVGRLSIGDITKLLERTEPRVLHPTYQADIEKMNQALADIATTFKGIGAYVPKR